ncbi:hypothetical protein Poly30_32650 [Planctomycetes bacterium Poly30]|uniref:Alpha/beta hydrolase family protein n=1 Tax=Saltatorellus ferox TaxID=2528018 RepID=A0A518EUI8_9BACT|nr:hypothetical protein Poly30_32650 [Planctomycetes bacterium Poly30]
MRIASSILLVALGASACVDSEGTRPAAGGALSPASGDQGGSVAVPFFPESAPTSQDYGPHQVQLGNATFAYLTRVAVPAEAMPLLPSGIGGTVFTYSLFVESTQAIELFALFVPDSPAGQRRPLLTAFHGFGTSHRDIDVRTRFFVEADDRDWFLVAPLQRNLADPAGDNFDINYASAQSQLHVEAVIQFMLENYAIDRDRLYGVGFSMGGGSALSYAARHRDRSTGAFAAVVNHTGSVALENEYANLPVASPVIDIMELIFGGPPSATPFEWQRSSLIELDAQGEILSGGRHMARNLGPVPTQTWFNSDDHLDHLRNQSQKLDQFMQGLVGADHSLVVVPGQIPNCDGQHCWSTLDQTMACDWLEQHSLNGQPLQGTVLADRAGNWEYFKLKQDVNGQFSSLDYFVDPLGNSLTLASPENVGQIETSIATLGLDAASSLKVSLEGFGLSTCRLVFTNALSPPVAILRDSLVLDEDCSGTSSGPQWCYDPSEGTLTLLEDEPTLTSWILQF